MVHNQYSIILENIIKECSSSSRFYSKSIMVFSLIYKQHDIIKKISSQSVNHDIVKVVLDICRSKYYQWRTQDFYLGGTGNGQVKKSNYKIDFFYDFV